MMQKIYIFSILYFLPFCYIYGNDVQKAMEGNGPHECGLPVYIVGNDSLISTVNYTSFPIYFLASTSGTSECKGFVFNDEERINYIATNFFEIQEDVAKGGGEYLDGLTTIIGCEGTNFKIILKEDYESIFNDDYSDSEKIYNALIHKIKNSELRNYCLDFS